jgi:hypothetical protein
MTFGLSAGAIGGLTTAAGGIGSALLGGNAAGKASAAQMMAAQAGVGGVNNSINQANGLYQNDVNNTNNLREQGINSINGFYGNGVNSVNSYFGAGAGQANDKLAQFAQMMQPYINGGNGALTAQQNLLGINGNDAQTAAINGIKTSGQYDALNAQGQDAILQNASATGGLRGGNVQGALAQFAPALLNQMIQQQYANLGGLTSMGANAANSVGNAGINTGNAILGAASNAGNTIANLGSNASSNENALNLGTMQQLNNLGINLSNTSMNGAQLISGLLNQSGAAQAGGALAQGKAQQNGLNSIFQGLGSWLGGGK